MSTPNADQPSPSPGSHSEWPVGHNVSTLHTRDSDSLEGTGGIPPGTVASVGTAPKEKALPGNLYQSRSKGTATPVCLRTLDKPIFDEKYVGPIRERNFIEGL